MLYSVKKFSELLSKEDAKIASQQAKVDVTPSLLKSMSDCTTNSQESKSTSPYFASQIDDNANIPQRGKRDTFSTLLGSKPTKSFPIPRAVKRSIPSVKQEPDPDPEVIVL